MKSTVLGLDLGTNSIGWALMERNEENNPVGIIDCGVRIFQEAVEAKTRTPKNVKRREARAARRLTQRRTMRKRTLKNALIRIELLPDNMEECDTILRNTVEYDPYLLRARGLDEKLTPFELGRALYHMNQRRGFLSNRKSGKKKDEGPVKQSIQYIEKQMEQSGYRTLGEYLFHQEEKRNRRTDSKLSQKQTEILTFTARSMYEKEFDLLWESQRHFYPEQLTDAKKNTIYKIIFFQRPLRIQKHLIGYCRFEPGKHRAAKATLTAQRFRILQDVNNLQIKNPLTREFRPLTEQERSITLRELDKTKKLEWKTLRRKLGIHEGELFNLENGGKPHLPGNSTATTFRGVLKKEWDQFSEKQQEQLVTDILTIDDENGFLNRMKDHWNFSDEIANKLATTELVNGYVALSQKAMKRIIPFLEKGLTYDKACEEVGYNHTDQKSSKGHLEFLDSPPSIPNPVVQKALWEVRKVMNALIRKYGKPALIRIEMAREMKQGKKLRDATNKRNREMETYHKKIKERLQSEMNMQQPTRDDILKYKLWDECGMTCPYTGKPISLSMLFSPEVEIEHIIPYSRSLDDSYMNKTLCLTHENTNVKKNMTPYEAYSHDEKRYREILLRIDKDHMPKMPWPKRKLFEKKEVDTDHFINRQLTDTSYICNEVKEYVKRLGVDVDVTKGGATAGLRMHWNLNTILARQPGETAKERSDHRHHAIDAIVTTLTTRSMFQFLSRIAKSAPYMGGLYDRRFQIPPPYEGFRDDVYCQIQKIVVSHAASRKISGALHEETALGLAGEGKKSGYVELVHRIPLNGNITKNQIEAIRDDHVKAIVKRRLAEFSDDPKKAFADTVFHKDGKTPIHTVRITEEKSMDTLTSVKDKYDMPYKYFALGSNHHVEIFENEETGKRKGIFVSVMEAARRVRIDHTPLFDRSYKEGWRFVMTLMINDMVIVDVDGENRIYRVQKMTGAGAKSEMTLRAHTASTLTYDNERLIKTPNTLQCKKISVDPIGQIRRCND